MSSGQGGGGFALIYVAVVRIVSIRLKFPRMLVFDFGNVLIDVLLVITRGVGRGRKNFLCRTIRWRQGKGPRPHRYSQTV